ncbi:hypothetical protein [Primorskyibacter sp. S87]|uniref:hypothetical protein n=1 Tax=Primorskyibacter sp. S87 TaxID=3415126 RepID=UPI003C79E02F
MSRKNLLVSVGGTAACALGIGFFMQSGNASNSPIVIPTPAPVQLSVQKPRGASDVDDYGMLAVEAITLTSATLDKVQPRRLPEPSLEAVGPLSEPFGDATLPRTPNDPDMPQLGCDLSATASAAPMAMVDLSVSAPCFGNQRVTVHHNGMMFTDATDKNGGLSVQIPALAERAVFIIALDSGQGAVASTLVEDLKGYRRVVLQWSGRSGFQVHAREFGASYGESGHVWSGSPTNQGGKGILTQLGERNTLEPQLAEIYSLPVDQSTQPGSVALSIETEVGRANCGRDIDAQSLELMKSGRLRTRDLTMSMPDCSAIGDFLVLNNLIEDLKIAAK